MTLAKVCLCGSVENDAHHQAQKIDHGYQLRPYPHARISSSTDAEMVSELLGNRSPRDAITRYMTNKRLDKPSSKDELDIRALIERWAKAVRENNRAGIRADHDSEMLVFDVPPPLFSRGLDAYMATWEKFLSWSEKPIAFDFHDVNVTAGKDVAFATAIGRCAGVDPNSKREKLEFRLTMCFRKIDGRWRVLHEHHSLPAE